MAAPRSLPERRPAGARQPAPAVSGVRPPAVAGRFYPAHPGVLARLVDNLLAAVPVPEAEPVAAGYVVPHAGYRYSGPTAAHAYARLRAHPGVARVLLIGPPHFSRLSGCAVPRARAWRTPLGDVPVDLDAAHEVVAAGLAAADDEPFAVEHSLEVQLPFLQRCLGTAPGGGAVLDAAEPESSKPVPVLPIAVGPSTVDEVVAVLEAGVTAGTIVLCSTDLSHYQTDQDARRQDARTAQAVLDLAPQRVGVRDACGAFALRGLLGWAARLGLRAGLLHLATSADTAGDRSRVVGYGAFAVHGD